MGLKGMKGEFRLSIAQRAASHSGRAADSFRPLDPGNSMRSQTRKRSEAVGGNRKCCTETLKRNAN
ncbi:MAG: hypothetical protein ACI9G1_002943 [Pirellulaceae bacterium]|jgi:hypothetical protein